MPAFIWDIIGHIHFDFQTTILLTTAFRCGTNGGFEINCSDQFSVDFKIFSTEMSIVCMTSNGYIGDDELTAYGVE